MNNLESLWKEKKIIFVLGSGGVGKTTISIALALHAVHLGKKVALISIDPAKRLASALGIPLSGELKDIALKEHMFSKGSLSALMLDQEQVFAQMVEKYAGSREKTQEIVSHSLYQMVVNKLAGAIEYMAMVKLYDVVNINQHDIIIVDTPPDNHTIKFLKNPNLLENFIAHGALDWLSKALNLSKKGPLKFFFEKSQRLFGDLAKILGLATLMKFTEFLFLLKDIIAGFSEYGIHLRKIIYNEKTAFFSVIGPQFMHFRRHQDLSAELESLDLKWDGVVINRLLEKGVERDLQALSKHMKTPKQENPSQRFSPEDVLLSHYLGQEGVKALIKAQPQLKTNFRLIEVREHSADLTTEKGRKEFVREIS